MTGKTLAYVVGARPNYMKIAPIHAALRAEGTLVQSIVHTGQHYDPLLAETLFAELGLPEPEIQLAVGSGSHGEQTAAALVGTERALVELEPDLVVVAGDVNSTLAGALAAVKLGLPVCHVEAGLRSFDDSMPEEHNRRLTDHLSEVLLVHCRDAVDNLEREGIDAARIGFVGNTMIDTLLAHVDAARERAVWSAYGLQEKGYLLVTLHRPALVDNPGLLALALEALGEVGRELPVIFPMHPRTQARLPAAVPDSVLVTPSLPYGDFLSLEAGASAVVTDSGGVQEETTMLGVPCFTLRDNTERPVTIAEGTNTLLGLDPERVREIPGLLALGAGQQDRCPPLWDGRAGQRAAAAILGALGLRPVVGSVP